MSSDWLSPDAIEAWWQTPSQKAIKRPYTAASVAALRDKFPENETSNAMAFKLRENLAKHQSAKSINLTTSPLEMSSQQMMWEAGMETAYVSGGLCSFTAVNDPSSDHADYTYDTLPKKVELLRRAQLLNNRLARAKGNTDPDACMLPLVADADSGFGLYTTVMKLTKMMVQAGAAGFHMDDLFPGTKRFDGKDGEAWTVVPMCELQKLVYYRADPHSATRITSSIDHRDRAWIMGATVPLEADYATLTTSEERSEWRAKAGLLSIDDAFKAACPDKFDEFISKTEKLNVSAALRVAVGLCPDFYFSADAARNTSGAYIYNGCIEASVGRSLEIAHLVEVLWPNASAYIVREAEVYAREVLAVHPDKWLGYNITGAFPEDGSRDEEVKEMNVKLAQLGYCWQFMPLGMFTALGVMAKRVATGLLHGGTYYYLQEISRAASKEAGKDSVEWWYKKPAILTDTAAEVIGDCLL